MLIFGSEGANCTRVILAIRLLGIVGNSVFGVVNGVVRFVPDRPTDWPTYRPTDWPTYRPTAASLERRVVVLPSAALLVERGVLLG